MAEIIEMPKLSDTMSIGTVVQWLKKEGDAVSSGDMIAEIETDKATMEMEVFSDGILLKQYAKAGDQVTVGDPICAIGQKGEAIPEAGGKSSTPAAAKAEPAKKADPKPEPKAETPAAKPSAPAESKPADKPEPARPATAPAPTDSGERIKASPLAKILASEHGVDLASLKDSGSGPGGRIVKQDVLAAAQAPAKPARAPEAPAKSAAPAPAQPAPKLADVDIPVSNMRAVIASRLLESKTQIPHFYLDTEVDMQPLLALRESVNAGLSKLPPEQGGIKLSVNDFILKAAIEALRRIPAANASWMGSSIRRHGDINLAFAVAVEDGLVTPTIKQAHNKTLRQIAFEARDLISKAQSKKLKPDEMSGSTFTVTNLGMYGIHSFFGIINPPNAAILSVGATVRKPVVDAKGQIVPGDRMHIGLSCDHRVIDGAVGAQLMGAIREVIENPALMLV